MSFKNHSGAPAHSAQRLSVRERPTVRPGEVTTTITRGEHYSGIMSLTRTCNI